MKKTMCSLLLATTMVVVGCGSNSGTATTGETDAFKNHDKNAIKPPPPDAMKAPSDFKSSLGSSAGGGTAVPGAGGK